MMSKWGIWEMYGDAGEVVWVKVCGDVGEGRKEGIIDNNFKTYKREIQ